ncbi:NAD(P)-binding protein [Aspergillus pseudoustus]|uniref:NAD(P)-binding protein n=1 Tax=Aspergillus pseudoustus TaxID=1810923 RepID=A0ABR4L1V7_9EURO
MCDPNERLLEGHVAIITGAGGGLGREYALLFAQLGAKVVVNDYGGSLAGVKGDATRAQGVVDEIRNSGGVAIASGHDISIPDEAEELVHLAVQKYGALHILVNNAGTAGSQSAHDNVNIESYTRVWAIACLGTSLMISKAWPTMEAQKYGRVINTSSDSILGFGGGGDGAYAASKGAVFALTKELGSFSRKHNIYINGVLPSAASRMSDLSPFIKSVTRKYFSAAAVAPLVAALASRDCPCSGEMFSVGAGRAARMTFATVPGFAGATEASQFVDHFDEVLGKDQELFLPGNCLEQIAYSIEHATGENVDLSQIGGAP